MKNEAQRPPQNAMSRCLAIRRSRGRHPMTSAPMKRRCNHGNRVSGTIGKGARVQEQEEQGVQEEEEQEEEGQEEHVQERGEPVRVPPSAYRRDPTGSHL